MLTNIIISIKASAETGFSKADAQNTAPDKANIESVLLLIGAGFTFMHCLRDGVLHFFSKDTDAVRRANARNDGVEPPGQPLHPLVRVASSIAVMRYLSLLSRQIYISVWEACIAMDYNLSLQYEAMT